MSEELADVQDLPNPVPVIVGVIAFILVAFVGVNVGLWYYAQQNAPVRKDKRVGAKKAKREQLRQGLQVLGD
jgi:hypothetical protein